MKRIICLLAIMALVLGGCDSTSKSDDNPVSEDVVQETTNQEKTTVESNNDEGFVIEYTETLKAQGFSDPLVLEEEPQRVISLSTGSIAALFDLEANLIAIPNTSIVSIPEDYKGERLPMMMSDDFNIENVIALNPDLVILGYADKETYGALLEEINIPVYYVASGHSVSFEATKQEAFAFAKAFANEQLYNDLEARYADLEEAIAEVQELTQGKSVMILQSAPPTHYIQTSNGTLGSMLDSFGFENVYSNDMSSLVQLDFEQALSYDPDYVFAVGTMSEEAFKAAMEADFANNPNYWNTIDAIANGDVVYLPIYYISNTGTDAIEHIQALLDRVSELLVS